MKRTLKRIAILAAIALVVLVVAACIIVHTSAFSHFVQRKAVSYAEAKVGAPVEMGSIAIRWSKLGAEVRGLRIYGRRGLAAPPLFAADEGTVGVRIVSLWRRQFEISRLILVHPVIHFAVDAQGQTNLPVPPPSKTKTNVVATIFNLKIRHFEIQSGEIYDNDREIPLTAALRNVSAKVLFDALEQQYTGSFVYTDGRIQLRAYQPVEHNLTLRFTASRDEFSAEPLLLSAGQSKIKIDARLTGYAHPQISGQYAATLLTPELARILNSPSLPQGTVATSGNFAYRAHGSAPPLDGLRLQGSLASPSLAVNAGQLSAKLASLRASYQLSGGSLAVKDLSARIFDGEVRASAAIADIAHPRYSVAATLRHVSLEALRRAMPAGATRGVRLVGTATAGLQAAWSRPSNANLHVRIAFSSAAAPHLREREIPLNGVLDLRYDAARDIAVFGQSHLQIGATLLALAGTLSRHSSLSVKASTPDLHETAALAALVSAALRRPGAAPPRFAAGLAGSAEFQGRVLGSLRDPSLTGNVTAGPGRAKKFAWRSLRATIGASSSRFAITHAILEAGANTKVSFDASAGLDHWSFKPDSPLSAHLAASDLSVAYLQSLLGKKYPVSGALAVTMTLSGSEQRPAGHAEIRIQKASAWNQPLQSASLTAASDGQMLHFNAQLRAAPAGQISADGSYSLIAKSFQARLSIPGIELQHVAIVTSRGLGVTGTLSGSVQGSGTLAAPSLSGNLRLAKLQVSGNAIGDVTAQLEMAQRRLQFAVNSTVDAGQPDAKQIDAKQIDAKQTHPQQIHVKGAVDLVGNYSTTATLDTGVLPLGTLLATYLPGTPRGLKGQVEIHAQVNGPLRAPLQIQAHAEVRQFQVAYQSVTLGLAQPLRMNYRAGAVTIEPAELKGTDTDLRFQGTVPLHGKLPLDLAVHGSVNLSVLQQFSSRLKGSGRIDVNIAASGSGSAVPAMRGDIRLVDAALVSASVPIGIEKANGDIRIANGRAEIQKLTATAGGGTLNVQGAVALRQNPQFNLSLEAQSVRVRYPAGIRSVLNANLQWNGTRQASDLGGRVVIDRLSFTRQFDLSSLVGQFAGSPGGIAPSPFQQHVQLKIAIQSGSQLRLASSKLSMAGAANLNVTGTLANPVILGRVTLSSGEVFFMGKRYDVQSGAIEFSNPVRSEPVLNVYVQTTVAQYKITLNFVGPVNRLRTNYTSEPALSASDIINLLAFGKTAEEAATAGSTPATLGAESVLAQGIASKVSGKLENLTGISQLTINPLAGSNQSNPGAQVALQERVTGSLLLTFSTDVTSTQNTAVQVQYRATPLISISILRDQNGGYAIDVRLRKTF
ncbi:MAG TPA: translocation/assembly module TamB domain-containing protein [Candidatus Acidoferrales bacterium]|nr:translocation/assembly module TamB domain-containing protein [Candidatus Acidoferrales bacterium]